jgi:3-mercaptopyruvate sulfurtransferase SseA
MTENGYAKPVLVTTEWLAEQLQDDNLVVAEVDENPELYDEGHIRARSSCTGRTISRIRSSATWWTRRPSSS